MRYLILHTYNNNKDFTIFNIYNHVKIKKKCYDITKLTVYNAYN